MTGLAEARYRNTAQPDIYAARRYSGQTILPARYYRRPPVPRPDIADRRYSGQTSLPATDLGTAASTPRSMNARSRYRLGAGQLLALPAVVGFVIHDQLRNRAALHQLAGQGAVFVGVHIGERHLVQPTLRSNSGMAEYFICRQPGHQSAPTSTTSGLPDSFAC